MVEQVQQAVIKYIGMLLLHQNCQLDLKEFKARVIERIEKRNLQAGFIISRCTEIVIELLDSASTSQIVHCCDTF